MATSQLKWISWHAEESRRHYDLSHKTVEQCSHRWRESPYFLDNIKDHVIEMKPFLPRAQRSSSPKIFRVMILSQYEQSTSIHRNPKHNKRKHFLTLNIWHSKYYLSIEISHFWLGTQLIHYLMHILQQWWFICVFCYVALPEAIPKVLIHFQRKMWRGWLTTTLVVWQANYKMFEKSIWAV